MQATPLTLMVGRYRADSGMSVRVVPAATHL
jgi:hypothetical protein